MLTVASPLATFYYLCKKSPMLIEFHAIRDPKYWLQMIAEQLSTPVINDEVHLPAMYGQGIF